MPKGKEQDVEVIGDEIEEKPDAPSDVVVDLNKKEELKKGEVNENDDKDYFFYCGWNYFSNERR